MKIKKFNKIDNAYSYSFFEWDCINPPMVPNNAGTLVTSNSPFVKSNIIFGENGNGKSKLVSILKSLDKNSSPIEEHRDRVGENQEIKIAVDGGTDVEFGTAWSHDDFRGKFLFFDKKFINDSVHSTGPDHAETAQRKQQRGRDIVYLGNFAEYNNEVDRIDGLRRLIKEKNENFIGAEKIALKAVIDSRGLTTDEVIAKKTDISSLNPDDLESLKEKLQSAESDLSKVLISIRDKSKITALKTLNEVPGKLALGGTDSNGDELPINSLSLFSFTVGRGVEATIHKIEHKKEFVKRGLSLITDSTTECPFCEQEIRTDKLLQIIQDYQEVFDETFNQEEKSVRDSLRQYKTFLAKLRDLQSPAANHVALEELKLFETVKIDLPHLEVSDEQKAVINAEIDLVIQKEGNVLEKLEESNATKISAFVTDVNAKLSAYNGVVKQINSQISQLKTDSDEGKLEGRKNVLELKVKRLSLEIFFLQNKSALNAYFSAADRYESNLVSVQSLDRIFASLKAKIVEEFKSFTTDYFELIAQYIRQISPSMDILDFRGQPKYDGRSTDEPAQCGFRVEYKKQDCSGSLSEGERQVIALAFFFARLSKEIDKDKIIVLDDPITSFDTGKRKSTAELIQKETEAYSQLFVFTCDPLFREYCLKQMSDRNFYYVLKSAGSSAIIYAPKHRETIYSCFEDEFSTIDTVPGTNENVVVFGQKLRFCLETKIREEYFGLSEDHLSGMITKVTGQGKAKFEKLFDNKDAILEIYSYCNTGGLAHYPKDGATSWNELKDKIDQYIALDL